MSPTIRIDEDVYKGLQKLAQPFEDTPNSIIRRLLVEHGTLKRSREGRAESKTRRRNQKGTPQAMLEEWLLYILGKKFSGRVDRSEAIEAIMSVLTENKLLVGADYEKVTTGETRVENRIAWARNALKERGLLRADSEKGYWELTQEGRSVASRLDPTSLVEKHLGAISPK